MKHTGVYLPAVLFVAVCVAAAFFDAPVAYLALFLSGMDAASYAAYVLILASAVVLLPLTAMPVIPVAAMVFGPFVTALLSIVGWTVGAIIAFLIARHVGRPVLARFVSLDVVDAHVAALPGNTRFLMIVLLRLALPVDIVSYALGLTARISLLEYAVATMVGVTWFSFGFAYLGNALTTGNMPLLISLGGASLVVFIGAAYVLKRQAK